MPSNRLCEVRDKIKRTCEAIGALSAGVHELHNWGCAVSNSALEELDGSLKVLVDLSRLERGLEKEEIEHRSDIDYSLLPAPPMRPTSDPEDPKRPWVKRELSGEELSAILATINPKDPKTVEQQIHQLWLDGIEQHNGVWYRWYQKNLTQQVGSVDRIPMPSKEDTVGVTYAQSHKAVNDLMKRIPTGTGLPGLLLDESIDRNIKDYE
jgi:hypothetical protein